MAVKPGYKQTEVGVIPEDWNASPLPEIIWFQEGPGLRNWQFKRAGLKVINVTNLQENGYLDLNTTDRHITWDEFERTYRHFLIDADDVVMASSGNSYGKTAIARASDLPLLMNTSVIRFKAKDRIDSSFMLIFLKSKYFKNQIDLMITGGAQPNFGPFHLRKVSIPLPPTKAEQEAIAEALSDADALIESLEQLLAKKRQLKQGAMQQLFRVRPEWEDTVFGKIVDRIVGGGTPSRMVSSYWSGNIPWMTVKDFAQHNPCGTLEYITREGLTKSASHLIPKKTLITSTRMALGKAVVFEVDVSINQDLKAIFPNKNVDTTFLYYWFQFNEARIAELGSGSTVMGLTLTELKKIPFQKPSLREQTVIAAVLSDMDAEITTLEVRHTKARQLKQGMMQELLTGRIRLVPSTTNIVPFPAATEITAPKHNRQIEEAAVLGVLAKAFGTEAWPLPRKRRIKLTYLLDRRTHRSTAGYLKKAAGPYNPATKYKGPEAIAQKNGYVSVHHNGKYEGFLSGPKIAQAEKYFNEWYGPEALPWLEQFRFHKTDELELLATVDKAMDELHAAGNPVSVSTVKQLIHDAPEWTPKLLREIFSDANLARAIKTCESLFA